MNALVGLNAVTLIFAALLMFAIGYRCYGIFIAGKVLKSGTHERVRSVSK